MSDKKWKDHFLRTSLPLEYLIAEKLNNLKCFIQGEYHYTRPNEQEVLTEFSVDIWAGHNLSKKNIKLWADLNYLIECKYCYPSVKWLFMPHTKIDISHQINLQIVHVLDQMCTRRVLDKSPLQRFLNKFPICFKGVEILPNDATSQNIERGKSQLTYAMLALAFHLYETQMMNFHDEDLHIQFLCPILITTADLYTLKKGLTLEDFRKANSPEDIAQKLCAVILTNPYSNLLYSYTRKMISNFHEKHPDLEERLKSLSTLICSITGEAEYNGISVHSSIDWDVHALSGGILIVNYSHFEEVLKMIKSTVVRSGKTLTQVGYLKSDIKKQKTWIVKNSDASSF